MSEDSKHLIFYINSRTDQSKTNDTESDFTTVLQTEWAEGYDRCYVSQLTVPRTEYQVKTGKNTFYIEELIGFNWVQAFPLTMPIGNYDSLDDIVNTLNLLLVAATGAANVNQLNCSFSYDGHLSKLIFTTNGNPNPFQNTTMRFNVPTTSNLDDVLGLYKGANTAFLGPAGFTFPFIVNSVVSNVYNLCCDNIVSSTSQKTTNILTCINVGTVSNNQYFSQVYQRESSSVDITTKSQNWHFYLQNQDRETVDTNGVAIAFTLVLYISKDKQQQLEKIRNEKKK